MESQLLLGAFLLGTLAFFEPCTIATHTLFIARIHKQGTRQAAYKVIMAWLAKSLLLACGLAIIVTFLPIAGWISTNASLILIGMALLYLVTRFVYLPVPHLGFHRLLPYHDYMPEPVQLGLSLPACTIPLFMVIAGTALIQQNILNALLAGLAFASGFSLPMAIIACRGIGQSTQDFLRRAAGGSPYFTALLLIGLALYLYLPQIDLSNKALHLSLTQAGLNGLSLSFLAGFVFSFNPVSFASIPVMLAYVTKAHEQRRAVYMGSAFVLGMITTHVALGVAAAIGGEGIKSVLGREWGLLLGPVLITLGLIWPGWLKLRLPWFGMRARKVSGIGGAFLLAIPFSVAVCPFCTPALLVTLTASAAIGSAGYGFALLLAFALGRSIPIILGAWSMGWLESLRVLTNYQRYFETIAGIVLILAGLYLLNEYFFIIKI